MKNFRIKTIASLFFALLLPVTAFANTGAELEHANIDVHNKSSLQNGARYFLNYCQGCHGLAFSRYNRVAADLGLTEEQVSENFIFTRDAEGEKSKVGTLMTSAIPPKDAAKWFGAPPPDLSLTGRSRGADWIYSYLKGFYLDPKKPTGVNNTVFKDVAMPHVLGELQGWQTKTEHGEHGHSLEVSIPGKMSAAEYDRVVRDITNFLVYVGEPAQLSRTKYGIWTMLFLAVFFVFAYLLEKEYWKEIH
jgi:ubiquinol-cytochrome c reductase cytochrome c1 subunit